MSHSKPLSLFILESFLWLPFCFALWYYSSPLLLYPVAIGTELLLTNLWSDWFSAVTLQHNQLEIITQFIPTAYLHLPHAEQSILIFDINLLVYSYGFALLLALSMAAPARLGYKLGRSVLAWLCVLLPIYIFSIIIAVFRFLLVQSEAQIAYQILGDAAEWVNIIVIFDQLCTLILPTIAPLSLWVWFYRDYLASLAPQFAFTQE